MSLAKRTRRIMTGILLLGLASVIVALAGVVNDALAGKTTITFGDSGDTGNWSIINSSVVGTIFTVGNSPHYDFLIANASSGYVNVSVINFDGATTNILINFTSGKVSWGITSVNMPAGTGIVRIIWLYVSTANYRVDLEFYAYNGTLLGTQTGVSSNDSYYDRIRINDYSGTMYYQIITYGDPTPSFTPPSTNTSGSIDLAVIPSVIMVAAGIFTMIKGLQLVAGIRI